MFVLNVLRGTSSLFPSRVPRLPSLAGPVEGCPPKAGPRALLDLEAVAGAFLPSSLMRELASLPGTRQRWLPPVLMFWSFLSMVLNPGMPCREAQRAVQAWWIRQAGGSARGRIS